MRLAPQVDRLSVPSAIHHHSMCITQRPNIIAIFERWSVPKRYFKHAVDRNRVKRQVREAFRRNKSIITQNLTDDHEAVAMAFVWLTDEKFPSSEVENRMVRLLTRISECL